MSHMVENMFYRQDQGKNKTPWHSLGLPIDDDKKLSIEDGIKSAGLDWEVRKIPLTVMSKEQMMSLGIKEDDASKFDGLHGKIVDRFATVRMSDLSILGNVGKSYEILQNMDAFKFFQPFLDSGSATLETSGSLFSGQKVWVLAKLNRPDMEISKDDTIRKYLMLSNSHDATMSLRISLTSTRVVCMNTLMSALNSKSTSSIRLRHSSNIKSNLDSIRDIVNTVDAEFEATAVQYRRMKNKAINQKDLRRYVKLILEVDTEAEEKTLPTRTINRIDEIVQLANSGKGNNGKTVWDAYMGFTEFATWRASRNEENRFDSLYFGSLATTNNKAFKLAVEMSA